MKDKLDEARSITFARNYTEHWILENIRSESHHSARSKIGYMVRTHFKHLKYALTVTPDRWGSGNHFTNFDVQVFHYYDKNIAVTFHYDTYNSKCRHRDVSGKHNDAKKLFYEIKNNPSFYGENVDIYVHRNSYAWQGYNCKVRYYQVKEFCCWKTVIPLPNVPDIPCWVPIPGLFPPRYPSKCQKKEHQFTAMLF